MNSHQRPKNNRALKRLGFFGLKTTTWDEAVKQGNAAQTQWAKMTPEEVLTNVEKLVNCSRGL